MIKIDNEGSNKTMKCCLDFLERVSLMLIARVLSSPYEPSGVHDRKQFKFELENCTMTSLRVTLVSGSDSWASKLSYQVSKL